MRQFLVVAFPAVLIAAASCSSSGGSAPAARPPAPAATAAPAAAAAAAGRGAAPAAAAGATAAAPAQGGAAAGGRGGRGGPPLTLEQRAARRDSIAAARAETVKQLMAQITGKEDQPAGEVFKNVQLMKTVPAGMLLKAMDEGIGRGLGRGCNDCHITSDWASDSLQRKKTARTMMGIVNDINTSLLPRMGPGRGGQPRTIQCVTCHRGGAAGSTAIIP
ncbi:MAG: photosynthetic reaction center cytochrome c subunit family protein [Gemmatimonadota bacterium]|nr:photosynthetic reaction center cytochrome c subunit family protein [Gemmatimonadota bacterium]